MSVKHVVSVLVVALVAGCAGNGGKSSTQKDLAHQKWNAARSGVLYGLAKQQYENGNFADCRKALDEAIKLNPSNAQLFVLQAKLRIEEGQLEPAEKSLQAAQALDAKDAEIDYLFGVIYQRWERTGEALERYAKASEREPAEPAYLLARAETLVALNREAEALGLLRERMTYFENSATIRDAVGQLLVQQGRHAEGAAVLRQASILAPEDATIREHLALALFYARDHREAAYLLERLVKEPRYGSRSDLWMALGECQLRLGQAAEARTSFETASQLNGGSALAWMSLAKAALEMNDLRRADLSARKAVSLEPQSGDAQLLLGYVRLRQNRLEEALAAFEKASVLDGREPMGLCMSGLVLERQGRHAEAIGCYARALKLRPNDELAATLMAQARPEE